MLYNNDGVRIVWDKSCTQLDKQLYGLERFWKFCAVWSRYHYLALMATIFNYH